MSKHPPRPPIPNTAQSSKEVPRKRALSSSRDTTAPQSEVTIPAEKKTSNMTRLPKTISVPPRRHAASSSTTPGTSISSPFSPRLPPLSILHLLTQPGPSNYSPERGDFSTAYTAKEPPGSATSIANLINHDPRPGASVNTPQSSSRTRAISAPRPTLPTLATAIPFARYSLSPAKRSSRFMHLAFSPGRSAINRGFVAEPQSSSSSSYHHSRASQSMMPRRSSATARSPLKRDFAFEEGLSQSPQSYSEPRQSPWTSQSSLDTRHLGPAQPGIWFALGPATSRDLRAWPAERMEAYDIGFEDALQAVRNGVVGIGGNQYAKPMLLRGEVPTQNQASHLNLPTSRHMPHHPTAPQNLRSYTDSGGELLPSPPLNEIPPYHPDHPNRTSTPSLTSSSAGPTRSSRQLISCFPCRHRKLKCSGEEPCAQCMRRGSKEKCVYAERVRRRGKGKKREEGGDWKSSGSEEGLPEIGGGGSGSNTMADGELEQFCGNGESQG